MAVLISLSGCTGLKTREDVSPGHPTQSSTEGTKATPEQPLKPETAQPVKSAPADPVETARVAVILGPGGIKSFAHVGVLKEFAKARVPVEAVVGIEWGALIGALYAQNGKIPEVEWKLYKMQKNDLPGNGLFSSRFKSETIKVMDAYLSANLSGAAERAKVEFACPSLSIWSGTLVWQTRGELKSVLSRCMPYPPMFKPAAPWMAAVFSVEDAVRYLKKRGYQVIVYVDVLGSGDLLQQDEALDDFESSLLWQEARRAQKSAQKLASDVIEVDTRSFKMFDFDARTGLVNAGEMAGAREVRKLADKYGF